MCCSKHLSWYFYPSTFFLADLSSSFVFLCRQVIFAYPSPLVEHCASYDLSHFLWVLIGCLGQTTLFSFDLFLATLLAHVLIMGLEQWDVCTLPNWLVGQIILAVSVPKLMLHLASHIFCFFNFVCFDLSIEILCSRLNESAILLYALNTFLIFGFPPISLWMCLGTYHVI